MRTLISLCFFSLFLTACKENKSTTENNTLDTEKTAPIHNTKYTLTPFEVSTAYPNAKIESMTYKGGIFDFKIDSDTYQLGTQTPDAAQKMCANSGKGQHIHLIVDNAPYAAKYKAMFDYKILDGEHYLLAFLSRSYHESIKTTDASVTEKIMVKDNSIISSESIESPMLFYSRPKGTYIGDKATKQVMLDFYLANVTLGKDYKVRADINGEEHLIDTWQPYYINGLPMGENTVTLTLIDKAGKKVDAPFNPVSRTFILKEDVIEE